MSPTRAETLRSTLIPPGLPAPLNPALIKHKQERARDAQNRIADAITRFAGSMTFVYVHIIWFAVWIGLRVEHYPFGLLTMIVSLEAIFLSTFVLISQNRPMPSGKSSPTSNGRRCRRRISRTGNCSISRTRSSI